LDSLALVACHSSNWSIAARVCRRCRCLGWSKDQGRDWIGNMGVIRGLT